MSGWTIFQVVALLLIILAVGANAKDVMRHIKIRNM